MRRVLRVGLVAIVFALLVSTPGVRGDDASDDSTAGREKKLEQMLSGVKLVGNFTIVGKDDKMPEEEYTIKSIKKLPTGDFWMFNARIKYGDKDYTVPLPLEVKWAADTPMVTLTDFRILGQGPFSARVVFYNGKYAGTWSHGKVGGHLFGRIEKLKEE